MPRYIRPRYTRRRPTRSRQKVSQSGTNTSFCLPFILLLLALGACGVCAVVVINGASSSIAQNNNSSDTTSFDTPIPTDTPFPTDTPVPTQQVTLNTQPTQPPVQPTAAPHCYPLSNESTCYEPGEYCRNRDHWATGVAGDGEPIKCVDNDGWRWEPY